MSHHTLLCIDDEAANVDTLKRQFRKKYQVLTATSGAEALKIIEKQPVQVIICDQKMPQMSGVEFLKQSLDIQPEAIRLLLTGYTDIESVIAAINDGQIYRYITKPWDPRELDLIVGQAVERYELQAELKDKNQRLEQALAELQKLDADKNQFMMLINHELKTPLTSIVNFSALLGETSLNEDQQQYLNQIETQVGRLQEIIERVLLFVSAQSGHYQIHRGGFDLRSALLDVEKQFTLPLGRREITVHWPENSVSVYGDQQLIKRVLFELFSNIEKFADPHSEVVVELSAKDGGLVHLSVSNSAPPMDTDSLRYLLRPFTLNEDVMNHSKGLGMGLSLCRALLAAHKSPFTVDSHGQQFVASFTLELEERTVRSDTEPSSDA